MHHDGAAQLGVDEVLERRQVPLAEEVAGQQGRARDMQVLLLRLRAGPGPDGVSSPQITRASRIRPRITLFAAATAAAARDSRVCTQPSDGRVPDIDSRMFAQRPAGTWCITIRNTAQAWKLSP